MVSGRILRGLAAAAIGLVGGSACAGFAGSQNHAHDPRTLRPTPSGYPKRTITLVAPANPGGGWDQMARLVQHVLVTEAIVPVPVEVVNRGGAGGTIGLAELVTRRRRDPYAVMVVGGVMLGAIITHQSPFGLTDAEPLARLVSEYEVVAVPADSPYRSMRDLVEAFRSDPGRVTWGGGSAGGTDHMLAGLIAQAAGVDPRRVNYVAFTGGGEAAAAVMGGQVTAGISGLAEWKGQAEAGRLRLIGISSPRRLANDATPTLVESGLDVTLENWRGIVAPPGIPEESRAWLLEALTRMRATAAWQDVLRRNDWQDSFLAGEPLARFIRADHERTAAVLARLGLGEAGEGYAAVGPYFFPSLVGALAVVSGLLTLLDGRRRPRAVPAAPGPEEPELRAAGFASWPSLAASALLLLGYVLAFEPLGFLIATPLYFFLQARVLGSRAPVRDGVACLLLTGAVYAVFRGLLRIALPLGLLA